MPSKRRSKLQAAAHLRPTSTLILAVALGPAFLIAQSADDGARLYAEHCAACHGDDAGGGGRAPQLAGNRRVRARSPEQIYNVIHNGILQSGMPAFNLPAHDLAALAAFVRSLNAPAAESRISGDPIAGERFFFGKGGCAACHMVDGRGHAVGPDLSDAGRELTLADLRSALLEPDAHITAGYGLATVELKDGKSIRGFERNRGNFDVELQDLQGRFHLLRSSQIAVIREEKQSLMPRLLAGPEELRDLIAYLGGLTGVKPGVHAVDEANAARGIGFPRIVEARPGDWLTYNGNVNGNRFSELSEVNRANVSRLAAKWSAAIPHFGLEVTPLVADGIMYVTGPNQVWALDAATGRAIWQYTRPVTPGLIGDAALGVNRGVAILGENVFMVTDNAHLIALNRTTGRVVWEQIMPELAGNYGGTMAPLVVKDVVIAGVSGGDRAIRGFLAAYKASTGERVWRDWTIPGKGEPGSETWKGKEPVFGGGATWLTGSYDPEADTLYWPTGNPYPDSDDRDRPGDNLYTDSILALDPGTGKLKWCYQPTPHDIHDWDTTEPLVLVDANYRGAARKLLLHADRNGFFYVLDRTDGKVLLGNPFVRETWASGIGPNGRPRLLPAYTPRPGGDLQCPAGEATNYGPTTYSPLTHLYYLMALEECRFVAARGSWTKKHPPVTPGKKYVRAIDIETGNTAWEIPQEGSAASKQWSGVLATAGGLVFYGDPGGEVVAVDDRNGKPLWHFSTGAVIKAGPMTYTADGKQFVAIAAGSAIVTFGLP
ncbi:MAG: PQQ-binding-like beta-propeller repeat protein [Bryobacteraceae bacterium]